MSLNKSASGASAIAVNARQRDSRELSAKEIDAVAGGTIMDIIIRAYMNAECLKRLTREGTVIDCSYPARL